MRIAKKVKVFQEAEETVDILCNKCGETCFPEHSPDPYGLIEKEVWGGYYSTHIGDMSAVRFSLCEKCVVELTKTFKIPHDVSTDYTPGFVPAPEEDKYLEEYNKHIEKLNEEYKKQKNN